MEVEVRVISNNECDASSGTIGGYTDNYNDQITDNMICAKEDDQDACQVSIVFDVWTVKRGPASDLK